MKTAIRNLMIIIILLSILMTGTPVYASDAVPTQNLPKHFRILAVGNSLAKNSLFYVYDIAKSLGIEDVKVGILHIGGCTLKKHWNNAQNDKKVYQYYKKEDGQWVIEDNISISEALADEKWDYVMFNSYSGDSGKPNKYKPLNDLTTYVRERVGKNTVFVWDMTWAYRSQFERKCFAAYDYDQKKMYKSIVKATKKKVLTNEDISIVIPAGTAVQNARTSSFGDTFTKDARHLTKDARYLVGLTLVSKILDISPGQIQYCPERVSEKMKKVAMTSARKAIRHPYRISKINM